MRQKPAAILLFIFTIAGMVLLTTGCPKDKCEGGVDGLLLDYTGLDGCRWIIELDSGERLEPVNLDQLDFEPADSLPVRIIYTEATDMMSICMVGEMVHISCIERMKSAQNKNHSATEDTTTVSGGTPANMPQTAPAYPDVIHYEMPDGYVLNIILKGDEYAHTAFTADGFHLLMTEDGFYEYASTDRKGQLSSTGVVARNPADRTTEHKKLLDTITKRANS
jgi:hypothetical protein